MTWSAPAASASLPFSGLLTVVRTVAPAQRASSILIRDDLRKGRGLAGARPSANLPVGGVHSRDRNSHEDLARARGGLGSIDEPEDLGPSGGGVDDGPHRYIQLPGSGAARC